MQELPLVVNTHFLRVLCLATSWADGCKHSNGGRSLSCFLSSAKDVLLWLKPALLRSRPKLLSDE